MQGSGRVFRFCSLLLIVAAFFPQEALARSTVKTLRSSVCPSLTCGEPDALYAHPSSCNLYVHCISGVPNVKRCPSKLHFNVARGSCDLPEAAHCVPLKKSCKLETPYVADGPTDALVQCNCQGICSKPHLQDCHAYYHCDAVGLAHLTECLSHLVYNATLEQCDVPEHTKCLQAPSCSCDNCRYPAADQCSAFWQCEKGKAAKHFCSSGLLFNRDTGNCDSAINVDCTAGAWDKGSFIESSCIDRRRDCDTFVKGGGCDCHEANCDWQTFVMRNCPKSCGNCEEGTPIAKRKRGSDESSSSESNSKESGSSESGSSESGSSESNSSESGGGGSGEGGEGGSGEGGEGGSGEGGEGGSGEGGEGGSGEGGEGGSGEGGEGGDGGSGEGGDGGNGEGGDGGSGEGGSGDGGNGDGSGDCKDAQHDCSLWAANNDCVCKATDGDCSWQAYVAASCPKSCGLCEGPSGGGDDGNSGGDGGDGGNGDDGGSGGDDGNGGDGGDSGNGGIIDGCIIDCSTGQYFPHPNDCRKFIQCAPYGPQEMPCEPGTVWDQQKLTCNHESTTACVTGNYSTPDGKPCGGGGGQSRDGGAVNGV